MSATWGTFDAAYIGVGVQHRPLTDALPEDMLVTVPAYARKHGLTPAEFLMQHMLAAGINVLSVDWRGPA